MSDLPPSTPPESTGAAPSGAKPPATRPAQKTNRPLRRAPLPAYTDNSKRDTMIALFSGLGVLLFIVIGFYMLQGLKSGPVGNKLTGTIVEKYATGVVEKEISVGKKGLASQDTESGFYFRIKVPGEERIYEVPVLEGQYQAKKVGDLQSFIRPPSEQK